MLNFASQPITRAGETVIRSNGQWLHFDRPVAIYTTDHPGDVSATLDQACRRAQREQLYAVGLISYEASSAFDLAQTTHHHLTDGFPLVWFGLYKQPAAAWDLTSSRPILMPLDWRPNITSERYAEQIHQIHQHIARGETYQVNFSYRQQAPFDGVADNLFISLNQGQNGQYGSLLNLGRHIVCSASPELFFTFDPSTGLLSSKPMKGTIHRGQNAAEDELNSEWLRHSEKNRAENLMIVDMIRNDMSRVATLGSVRVPKLFDLERYETLWTMTSTIASTVQPEMGLPDIFQALFPCASITGAPKVSTMGIIRELESTPRGIYCGSIGLIEPNGRATFNVAIRTAVVDQEKGTATYGVGGGIVWDSDPQSEWTETKTKSKILFMQSDLPELA